MWCFAAFSSFEIYYPHVIVFASIPILELSRLLKDIPFRNLPTPKIADFLVDLPIVLKLVKCASSDVSAVSKI